MLRRSTVVPAIFAGVIVLAAASCGQGTSPTTSQDDGRKAVSFASVPVPTTSLTVVNNDMALYANSGNGHGGVIPVGFDRSATMISWVKNGAPVANVIATSLPVLHFSGHNVSGNSIAYTTLERLLPNQKRVVVTWQESRNLKIDDFVPTGNLVVQNNGSVQQFSVAGEFVVFAAWSPTDADILAYGYRRADVAGIAVINIKTSERLAVTEASDLNPDVFFWQDSGQAITVFQEIPDESIVVVAGAHGKTVSHRARTLDVSMSALRDEVALSIGNGSVLLLSSGAGLEVASQAGNIRMVNIMGGDDNEIVMKDKSGNSTSVKFKAEQIRARNRNGVAFVNSSGNDLGLYAVGGSADAAALAAPLSVMTTVSYYIPDPSGSTVNFTQVGESYPGKGCGVTDHKSTTSMAYAIDIQLSGSSYDSILASGNGTTVTGYSSVTCNSMDTSGCAIYSSSCAPNNNNSGWGNDVILSHADGYYTKYTHLESANFQVHTCGASASAGCWLGNEGGTGNTIGTKNGCGDHVHFQKQTGSGLNASSASVSFVEDSIINSSDCVAKYPTLGAMSCSL